MGPVIGGIIGGFTYDYTQCSSEDIQRFRSSFRRKKVTVITETGLRSESPTVTEMSYTPTNPSSSDFHI